MSIVYSSTTAVEIFQTNVIDRPSSYPVLYALQRNFPHLLINFDLEDRDRILRVEGREIDVIAVCNKMKELGFCCSVL